MSEQTNPVIIYTDNPEKYIESDLSSYVKVECCSCPDKFCKALVERQYSGIILNVNKVMRTPCCDRNRILSISSGVPTIRTLEKESQPLFLDDHKNFICDCLTRKCNGSGYSCPVNVQIPVEVSLEDDPAMAQSITGTIHHISEDGCTFHTNANLADNSYLYLKIFSLNNKLPILSGVYREQNAANCSCGYEVKFLDIKDDQRDEIKAFHENAIN